MSSTEEQEQEMFTCKCGEHSYLLADDSQDESAWCECGLRIDQQREQILDARR